MSNAPLFGYVQSLESERAAAAHAAKGAKDAKGGWLYMIALVLGKSADALGERIVDKAKELDAAIDSGDTSTTEINAKLQAMTQEMKMLMQTISTVIKSLGEGETGILRKS